jgi:uncharacterized protein YcbX
MGKLKGINSFPLSGARQHELSQAAVGTAGIPGDRRYVVYDPNKTSLINARGGGKVQAHARISQKRCGGMALLNARYGARGELVVTHPTEAGFVLTPEAGTPGSKVVVEEFGDATPCYDVGEKASVRISEMLGGRAVALARKSQAWARGGVIPPHERAVAPLHIINQASVAALQEMGENRGMEFGAERFRANLIVGDFDAFEENGWIGRTLAIGDLPVMVSRPSARCKVPGIDQLSGQLHGDVPALLHEMNGSDRGMADFGVYGYPLLEGAREIVSITLDDEVRVAA